MGRESITKQLWRSGAMRLLPGLALYAFAFGIVYPLVPTLATDYFASIDAGHPVRCEAIEAASSPASHSSHSSLHSHDDAEACHNAHSTVVYWSSTTSFFSNTVVAFLVAPILGDLSDRYGRKPLFMVGLLLSCLPLLAVFGFLYGYSPFYWYYVANAAANTNALLSASCAFMADKLDGRLRAAGFGLIAAVVFGGFAVAPLAGVYLSPIGACWAGLCSSLAAMLYIVVILDESLPPEAQAKAQKEPLTLRTLGTFKLFGFLGRSRLFIKLATCLCLLGVAQEGLQDLLLQYLQLKVNFTTADQGVLFAILGGCNMVVSTVVLSYGVTLLGEQRMLLLGLVFFVVYQLMLGLVTSKDMAFAAVGLGSLAGVSFPAISTIKANNCGPEEQGMLQGALNGLRAIAQGIGPLLFALLFSLFTRTDSSLPYIPGMPFFFSCLITLAALIVASTIHPDAGMGNKRAHGGAHNGVSNGAHNEDSDEVGHEEALLGGGSNVEVDIEEERVGLLGSSSSSASSSSEGERGGEVCSVESMKLRETMGAAAGQIPSIDHP